MANLLVILLIVSEYLYRGGLVLWLLYGGILFPLECHWLSISGPVLMTWHDSDYNINMNIGIQYGSGITLQIMIITLRPSHYGHPIANDGHHIVDNGHHIDCHNQGKGDGCGLSRREETKSTQKMIKIIQK